MTWNDYLQIARNVQGWFVIELDPDDEYRLNFRLVGPPWNSRDEARRYRKKIRRQRHSNLVRVRTESLIDDQWSVISEHA